MSRDKRRLSEDEQVLWGRVAKTVRRAGRPKPEQSLGPTQVAIQPARREKQLPLTLAESPPLANRSGEKRVRRGKLDVGANLDLHGHTQASGRSALHRFLLRARADGEKVVVVITGVGRGGHGALKQRLPEWLSAPELRDIVSSYAPAHRAHGGAGAFYVFLRRTFTEP